MKNNKLKIVIILLVMFVLITIINIPKLLLNKKEEELPEVKLKDIEKNETFAIMVPNEQGDGYTSYNKNEWPTSDDDYYYVKSECIDNNGKVVEKAISYNEENNTASLTTNSTVYCTLYFDKYNYMKVITKDIQFDSSQEPVPVYMSENVKHVKFLNSIKDDLNPSDENTMWWDLSDIEQGTPKRSVIAWIEPIDDNYDTLFIGSKNKIRAISLRDAFKNGVYSKDIWEDNLEDIDFNNMLDTSKTTTMYGMFASNNKLITITGGIEDWDISNVTTMGRMFQNCTTISNLEFLRNWNTQKITAIDITFYGCKNLINLDFMTTWNVSNLIGMNDIFSGCTNLSDISGISNWNVSKVTNMGGVCYNCRNLESINLSDWDTSKVENVKLMFSGCTKLKIINMQNATFTQIKESNNYQYMFNGVPESATIIVKDTDQKNWIITNKIGLGLSTFDENNIKLPTEL